MRSGRVHTIKIACLTLGLLSLAACSQKKNKWLNRNFHAMGTYYNILYNGNIALEKGKEQVREQYTDDFWTVLPVERRLDDEEKSDDNSPDGQTLNKNKQNTVSPSASSSAKSSMSSKPEGPPQSGSNNGMSSANFNGDSDASDSNNKFERAETKANKAIQKHNMLINGTEYNYKMDEAFLLLGKARYHDQRYLPALEAFNYILTKYRKSNLLARAKIWHDKTLLRLENYDRAFEDLDELLTDSNLDELEEKDYATGSAAMAQAHLDLKEPAKALKPLDSAIKYTEIDRLKGRYLFIKGQLHDSLHQPERAKEAFNRVIDMNRKIPRKYLINAHLEKAKNFDLDTRNPEILEEHLFELAEDRENRPFLDIIYYQIAQFYRHQDNLPEAVTYYNKSLRTNTRDKGLLSRTYLILGNINFDDAAYKSAGKYYDSTLINLEENTRHYRDIQKKRDNLSEVIKYEGIAQETDSILNLVRMSPDERQAHFTKITDSLKEQAIAKAEEQASKGNKGIQGGNLFGKQKSTAGGTSAGGSFYFYDQNQRKSGLQSFKSRWGDRALQDNWRYKTGGGSSDTGDGEDVEEIDIEQQIENDPQYQVDTYLEQIPSDEEVIDSISDKRNFAYYQLGIIYKEQFEEYQLAIDKLTGLLNNNPEDRLIIPSKYYLYKIFETTDNPTQQQKWKQNILTEHPDSRYASILRNPRSLKNDKNNPQEVYLAIYQKFKGGQYKTVITQCDEAINRFTGNNIVPKLELLKAMSKGRYHGFDTYKESLNYVALTYPQSAEGKKAEKMLKESLPKIADSSFTKKGESFKLVYSFSSSASEKAQNLKQTLDKAIAEKGLANLSTSIDIYNPEKQFVVVHGLDSKRGAEGFGEQLKKDEDYQIDKQNTGISTENYTKVLIHKIWNKYQQHTP